MANSAHPKPWFCARDDGKFRINAGNRPVSDQGEFMMTRFLARTGAATGALALALTFSATAQAESTELPELPAAMVGLAHPLAAPEATLPGAVRAAAIEAPSLIRGADFTQPGTPIAAAVAAPVAAMGDVPASLPGAMPPSGTPDMRPEWNPAMAQPAVILPDARSKAAWLGECRRRMAYYYDDGRSGIGTGGILGIIAGGVAGGFIGDAVAGAGDKALGAGVGALGGAVLGGLAGSAIDKAAKKRKLANVGYDYCEAYFDDYYRTGGMTAASQGHHGHHGHSGHAMQPRMVAVSQPSTRPGEPICEEVVTESYVPVKTRTIPARPRRSVPDKRIRVY
jgi:hypothetical protein